MNVLLCLLFAVLSVLSCTTMVQTAEGVPLERLKAVVVSVGEPADRNDSLSVQLLRTAIAHELPLAVAHLPEPVVFRRDGAIAEIFALDNPSIDEMAGELGRGTLPEPLVFTPFRRGRIEMQKGPASSEFDVEVYLAFENHKDETVESVSLVPHQVSGRSYEENESIAAVAPSSPTPTEFTPKTTLIASVTDRVTVSMVGRGWIFTGMEPDDGGLVFTQREISDVSTTFSFDTLREGDFRMSFQQQNNLTGTVVGDVVHVSVQGKLPSSEPLVFSLIDNVAQEPEKYVSSVLTVGDLYRSGHFDEIRLGLGRFLDESGRADGPMLLLLYEGFLELGDREASARILERYIDVFPGEPGNDKFLFELGNLYELEPLRNERIAHRYYSMLIDAYPASIYYDDAALRAGYIERHFLKVR